MNIKLQCCRFLIAVDALTRRCIKKRQSSLAEKTVAIVFQQIFGDAVVIQNSLECYTRLFPREKGYRILLLARPSVSAFMEEVLKLPTGIVPEPVDFKRFLEDYRYYREIIKRYRGNVDTMIVPGSSLSAEIFCSACSAKEKVALVGSVPVKRPVFRVIFYHMAYTKRVIPDRNDMMLKRHRLLVHTLGEQGYKAYLPELLPKERIIAKAHYCVMAPGSSKMEKCWPASRFCEIADYVIEKYGMEIHLCGGMEEAAFEAAIMNGSRYPERIVSHIGKTTFSDWSSIIQHADLVIGNDSATMHLAAAGRRKAVCIAGAYDKGQFFPYQVDALEPGDRLPVTIVKDVPCRWCRTEGYYAGFGNRKCRERIAGNLCACCIDEITVRDVEDQIEQLLADETTEKED